ncbi:MAG: T9SS type A sorting domain-containing protein [Flavobacteriales bacterium]
MRNLFLLPTLILPLFAAGQFTIDFEETNGGDTTLTAGGIEWTMTGDFNCDSYEAFFCGEGTGLNRYMDSGWEDGASEGYMGSLKPTDPTVVFQLGTDTATMCIWPASVDGLFPGEGTVTFAGILPDGSTIAETMELATEDYSLASYLFDSEIWSGVDILELTVTIEEGDGNLDHLVFDNIEIASTETVSRIQMLESTPVTIFPNPTLGEVYFSRPVTDVMVFDLAGKKVTQHAQPCSSIDLESLEPGWYAVQFSHGGQRWMQQIIRE